MRLGSTKRQDPASAAKYLAVGRALLRTAKDLEALADLKYGNGLAIIAIHSAIAYTDALTTAYRGIRSTDGDHRRAADVLAHAMGHRVDSGQLDRLRIILDAKTHASYSGNYYTLVEGRRILEEAEIFVAWAEDIFRSRPATG